MMKDGLLYFMYCSASWVYTSCTDSGPQGAIAYYTKHDSMAIGMGEIPHMHLVIALWHHQW